MDRAYFDALTSEMVDLTTLWSNQNSGSYNPAGLIAMSQLLRQSFDQLGASYKEYNHPELSAPIFTWQARPEAPFQVLLNGHYDTVFGPDHSFQEVTQDGDCLRGPGVADMKGGIVVMLYALKALEASAWKDSIGWQVLLNPDEEIGTPHSRFIHKALAQGKDLGLIFESSLPSGEIILERKGVLNIKITSHGKAAHAGKAFDRGINATVGLARIIQAVDALNHDPQLAGNTLNIGIIGGGEAQNIVPDLAYCFINIRLITDDAASLVIEKLNHIVSNYQGPCQIELEQLPTDRPFKSNTPTTQKLFETLQSIAQDDGFNLGSGKSGGATDGSLLASYGLPNIDNLGVSGDNLHSAEEYMIITSLPQRAFWTYQLLKTLTPFPYDSPPA